MEELDLSAALASLMQPRSSIILSKDQFAAIGNAFLSEDNDVVGVIISNEGAGVALASPIRGTRPIPSESHVDEDTNVFFDALGGSYVVEDDDYNTAYQASVDANRELIDAEQSARALAELEVVGAKQ